MSNPYPVRITPRLAVFIREVAARDAYDRRAAAEEACCGVSITLGGHFDPTGVSCDLTDCGGNHAGSWEGTRLAWTGGGSCAGDLLPIRNLRVLPDPAARRV